MSSSSDSDSDYECNTCFDLKKTWVECQFYKSCRWTHCERLMQIFGHKLGDTWIFYLSKHKTKSVRVMDDIKWIHICDGCALIREDCNCPCYSEYDETMESCGRRLQDCFYKKDCRGTLGRNYNYKLD